MNLEAWMAPRRALVEARLRVQFHPRQLGTFDKALLHPLNTPGKRIRPLLCLAAWEALTGLAPEGSPALEVAAALELVHTYSLVHDDLPAMDDADTRRGMPTVHALWGDAGAILVGDALLTEAFAVLAETTALPPQIRCELVAALAAAAGARGMVAGQALDIGMAGRVEDEPGLIRLHRLKTGELLEASVVCGGLAAGATAAQRRALQTYGAAVGLAFQIADDILDAEEDAREGRPSFATLFGVDGARARAQALVHTATAAAEEAAGGRAEVLQAIAAYIVDRQI